MHMFELAVGALCGIEGGYLFAKVGATLIDTLMDIHVSLWNDTKKVKLILVHSVVYIYIVQTGIDFRRWYASIGSQSNMQQLDLSAYSWNEPSEENVNEIILCKYHTFSHGLIKICSNLSGACLLYKENTESHWCL